jgi:hypothetical protein
MTAGKQRDIVSLIKWIGRRKRPKLNIGINSGSDIGGLEEMEDDPKAYYTGKRDWRAIILRFVLLMCSIALLVYWLLRIGLLHPP